MTATVRRSAAVLLCLALCASCRARSCDSEKAIEREQPRKKRARNDERVELCLLGVRALSEYSARCEDALPWMGTIDRAVAQLRPACEAMVDAPGTRYLRDEIEACASALAKTKCGAPSPEACRIAGTLPKGSSCLFGSQCARGLLCKNDASPCGKCLPFALDGQPCGDGCDLMLTCIDGRCRPPLGEGESCTRPFECKRALRCVPDPKGIGASVCRPYAKEGEPCSTFDCEPTLRCESGTCRPRAPPKSPGSPCLDSLDCLDFVCVAGTCRALAELEEPCPDAEHADRAPCSPSFSCVEGRCKAMDAHACP